MINDTLQNQYGMAASRGSNKTFTPPLPATGAYHMIPGTNGVKAMTHKAKAAAAAAAASIPTFQHQQRQPSPPVVLRHVFTSGQGIPVTMAVLPQPPTITPEVSEYAVVLILMWERCCMNVIFSLNFFCRYIL